MKFLITGAYGFVGTNLCKYLVSKGHECHALDIPAARRPDVPYASFHSWDELESTSNLFTFPSSFLPVYDCVVHLAGKAHDLKKVSSPESYFEINVGLTQRIFDALLKEKGKGKSEKVTTFIYFSSSKADANGETAYARSKAAAEKYLQDTFSLFTFPSSLQVAVLRPAMIHGPGNKGNLNLLWGLAKRGLPWPLAAFENKRSFTSIGNICAIVEALAQKNPDNSALHLHLPSTPTPTPSIHTFPIADDEPLSTNRLIELIAETCGKKAKLWRVPKSLMRLIAAVGSLIHFPLNLERLGKLTEDSIVDNSAVKEALGWNKLPIAAEEGLRETLKSFLDAEAEAQRLANWNMSEYKANQASHTL